MDYYAITRDMTQLGLKGSRLTVYALVYKFSSDGQSTFFGSLSYVSEWCGISRPQAAQILRDLTSEGYITRDDSSGRPRYKVAGVRKTEYSENRTPCSEIRMECSEIRTPSYNREDNKSITKTHTSPRTREDGKVLFGEFVRLTQGEHDKLVAEYGAEDTARMIEILDVWLADQKKDPYKSHYIAIKKWCYRALQEQKTAELERQTAEQRLKNAQEAAQRVNAPKAPETHYADLAEIEARRKAIEDKYKN